MIAYERPRALWHLVTLGVVIAVCATAAWTGRSALAGPRPEEDAANAAAHDFERQGTSIGRTHEVGLAMTSWLADISTAGGATAAAGEPTVDTTAWPDAGQEPGDGAAEQPEDPAPEQSGEPDPEQPAGPAAEGPDPTTADWSACPPISYQELADLLAGTFAGELPRTDGWGHPFEYCLDRERTGTARYTVGVRSPGRDGRWQGETYPVGGFAADELDGDLLWIDGYFVTWPRPR